MLKNQSQFHLEQEIDKNCDKISHPLMPNIANSTD